MKVLMAMPFSPVPPDFGGALRVYHLLRQLAKRHEVTALTYGTAEDAARIRKEFDLPQVQVVAPTWKAANRRAGQLFSTLAAVFQRRRMDPVAPSCAHQGRYRAGTPGANRRL